jgi:hypothetical protein
MSINISSIKMIKTKAEQIGLALTNIPAEKLEESLDRLPQDTRKIVLHALYIIQDVNKAQQYAREFETLIPEKISLILNAIDQDNPVRLRANANEPSFLSLGGIKKAELREQVQLAQVAIISKNQLREEKRKALEKKRERASELEAKIMILKDIYEAVAQAAETTKYRQDFYEICLGQFLESNPHQEVLNESIPAYKSGKPLPNPNSFLKKLEKREKSYKEEKKSLNAELKRKDRRMATKTENTASRFRELQKKLIEWKNENEVLEEEKKFYDDLSRQLQIDKAGASMGQKRNDIKEKKESILARLSSSDDSDTELTPQQNSRLQQFTERLGQLCSMAFLCEKGKKPVKDLQDLVNTCLINIEGEYQKALQQKKILEIEIGEISLKTGLHQKRESSVQVARESQKAKEKMEAGISGEKKVIEEILFSLDRMKQLLDQSQESGRSTLFAAFEEEKTNLLKIFKTPTDPLKTKLADDLDIFEACLNLPRDYPIKPSVRYFGKQSESLKGELDKLIVKWKDEKNSIGSIRPIQITSTTSSFPPQNPAMNASSRFVLNTSNVEFRND